MKNLEIHFKNEKLKQQEANQKAKAEQKRIAFHNKSMSEIDKKNMNIALLYIAEQKKKGNNITLAYALDYLRNNGLNH